MPNAEWVLQVSTKPHDMNANLTRVLLIMNDSIRDDRPRGEVVEQFEDVPEVDSVIHVGDQIIELYVLQRNLTPALRRLGAVFVSRARQADTMLSTVIFNGESYGYHDFINNIDQAIIFSYMED